MGVHRMGGNTVAPRKSRRLYHPTGLGARIRALRLERGWTQEDLAREAGVKRAWISLVEQGIRRKRINVEYLERTARALGVDMRYLITGYGPPPRTVKADVPAEVLPLWEWMVQTVPPPVIRHFLEGLRAAWIAMHEGPMADQTVPPSPPVPSQPATQQSAQPGQEVVQKRPQGHAEDDGENQHGHETAPQP